MAHDLILVPALRATLSKLVALASDQLNLASEWKEDLKALRLNLEIIMGVLQQVEANHATAQYSHMKPCLLRLREAAEEAEQVLEEIAYESLRHKVEADHHESKLKKVSGFFTPHSNPHAFHTRIVDDKIKLLNKYLNDIKSGLQLMLANHIPELRAHQQYTPSYFGFPDPCLIVERKEDMSKIVSLLIGSSNNQDQLPVVAIVGMGGVGKTTLMKSVCQVGRVRANFGKIIWVRVSEMFDVERILREMLVSVTGTACENVRSKETIVEKLKTVLGETNYLLVLDDVWNEEKHKWDELRRCLWVIASEKKGVIRVVVTTRSEKVGLIVRSCSKNFYHPRLLTHEECWSIIKQRAFRYSAVPPDPELVVIGKEISRKCEGVSLLASVVGETLQNVRERDEWRAIEKTDGCRLLEGYSVILEVLKSSLDHLSEPALKQCFAFCSIFPKGFVVDKEMLIQLWMAEGLLQSSSMTTDEEELGDRYFNDLLSYSLLQEVGRDTWGNVKACKMQNWIHEFATLISEPETMVLETHSRSSISDIRHLNHICGCGKSGTLVSADVAQKLHTLFSKHEFSSGLQVDFKNLRVLSFRDASNAKQLPICFSNSKFLRFIDISGTQIAELPKFVTKLYNLQTLKFTNCKHLKMPLQGIGRLINLRHIYFDDEERMPANIGRLTSLRTLQLFFVGATQGRKIEELGSLHRLRGRLEIRNLELVKDRSEAMKAKLHEKAVDELELKWGPGSYSYNGKNVLEGLIPNSNLRKLCIEGYEGESLPSWMLERPQWFKLKSLTIRRCSVLKQIRQIHGFPSLGLLTVEKCNELTSIAVTESMSNSLAKLDIKSCPKLKTVPEDGMSSLVELIIGRCENLEWIPTRRLSSLHKLHITLCKVRSIMEDNLPTYLEDLYLYGCPNLRCIPSLDGHVFLKSVVIEACGGLEYLPRGLFSSCTALEVLTIRGCDNLVAISEESKELPSLVELKIERCRRLSSFPEGLLGCFPSLKRLSIGPFFKELKEFPGLSSIHNQLQQLHLFGWAALSELPSRIQSLTALEELQIWNFSNVESLPEWLGNLSSLQHLEIHFCSKLKFLPSTETIRCLSNLQKLEIRHCPMLEEGCEAGSQGSEWLKISHIPNISIAGKIQSQQV